MKKIILAGILATTPLYAYSDTGPGCGLGSQVFDGQEGLVSHLLAGTTNGLASQSIAMTIGTFGCDVEKAITTSSADMFINNNLEKVARDMSSGQGESMDALATMLNIEEKDKSTFFKVTKANFGTIYGHENVNSIEVLKSLKAVMLSDQSLAKYVS